MIKGVQDLDMNYNKLYHFAWVDQRKLQGYISMQYIFEKKDSNTFNQVLVI